MTCWRRSGVRCSKASTGARHRRGPRIPGTARVHGRRPARRGRPGIARAGARRAAVVGLGVAAEARDGEPRARDGAQDGLGPRARDRARADERRRRPCRPACSTASACWASSGSTARCGRSSARSGAGRRARAARGRVHDRAGRERGRGAARAGRARARRAHARRAARVPEGRSTVARPARTARGASMPNPTPTNRSTSPTCTGSCTPHRARGGRRRRAPHVDGRPARSRARRCSPAACRRSCPTSTARTRSTSRASIRPRAAA